MLVGGGTGTIINDTVITPLANGAITVFGNRSWACDTISINGINVVLVPPRDPGVLAYVNGTTGDSMTMAGGTVWFNGDIISFTDGPCMPNAPYTNFFGFSCSGETLTAGLQIMLTCANSAMTPSQPISPLSFTDWDRSRPIPYPVTPALGKPWMVAWA